MSFIIKTMIDFRKVLRGFLLFVCLASLCGCKSFPVSDRSVSEKSPSLDLTYEPSIADAKEEEDSVPLLMSWYFESERILGFENEERKNMYVSEIAGNKQYSESRTKLGGRIYTDIPAGPAEQTAVFYGSTNDSGTFQETIWGPWKYKKTDILVLDQFPLKVSWEEEHSQDTGLSYLCDPKKEQAIQLYCFIDEIRIDLWQIDFISEDGKTTCSAWYALLQKPVSVTIRPARIELAPVPDSGDESS